jgi:hypothetical protein
MAFHSLPAWNLDVPAVYLVQNLIDGGGSHHHLGTYRL